MDVEHPGEGEEVTREEVMIAVATIVVAILHEEATAVGIEVEQEDMHHINTLNNL